MINDLIHTRKKYLINYSFKIVFYMSLIPILADKIELIHGFSYKFNSKRKYISYFLILKSKTNLSTKQTRRFFVMSLLKQKKVVQSTV